MKNFFIFLGIGIGTWIIKFLTALIIGKTSKLLQEKRKPFYGILNIIVFYFFGAFLLFSYDFFIPIIIFSLRMLKTFAWVSSLTILASMIYTSIACANLTKENRIEYGFGKIFCLISVFIINLLNGIGLILIKSLFETSYENISYLPFDLLSIAIFIFDIGLIIYILKSTSYINNKQSNQIIISRKRKEKKKPKINLILLFLVIISVVSIVISINIATKNKELNNQIKEIQEETTDSKKISDETVSKVAEKFAERRKQKSQYGQPDLDVEWH